MSFLSLIIFYYYNDNIIYNIININIIRNSDLENAFESEAFANPKAYEDMGYLFNWDQIFEVPVAEI